MTDEPDDAALEALVLACLDSADPHAELQRRAAERPELRARAERLLGQVSRLERLDAHALAGEAPSTSAAPWPEVPGVELRALIGRGGQGLVYRGEQRYLGRAVAVKVLAPELQTPAFLERFRREARMLAGLQHPHIVACYDAGETPGGQCFIVMEFVDGPNLFQWLGRHGKVDVRTALGLVRDLAGALAHAQRIGLVHRDVKPENVLLQPAPHAPGFPFVAKLADLGLARPIERRAGASLLTPVGAVVGTPVTMAPEQFDAPESVDHRADLYGLGCILYHLLAGRPAFQGTAVTDILMQKFALRDAGDRVALEGVPAEVNTLLGRLLAWSPDDRPSSYDALSAELTRLESADTPPTAPIRARGRRTLPLLLVLVSLGAVGVGVAAWRSRRGTEATPPLPPAGAHEAATPQAPVLGPPLPLFDVSSGDAVAGWDCDAPRRWSVDELGAGVLVNSPRTRTTARRALTSAPFELRGAFVPRFRTESPSALRVPIDALGLRLEMGADEALVLAISPVGETRFRAAWILERRTDGAWQAIELLGSSEGEYLGEESIEFALRWSGSRATATCGPHDARTAAQATFEPKGTALALEVYAERGVAVLTGWTIAAAD